MCGKYFSRRDNLYAHQRLLHGLAIKPRYQAPPLSTIKPQSNFEMRVPTSFSSSTTTCTKRRRDSTPPHSVTRKKDQWGEYDTPRSPSPEQVIHEDYNNEFETPKL
nr:uncharacterized protein LOC111414036 [Onthophagus taurus]